ncbi:MAG TPA: hypothetical protein VFF65_08105, partial [Phycisphaerales bacterium]|nr:hypothetical protein [Phycisphaerales bacterium]
MSNVPDWLWFVAAGCVLAPGAWLLLTGRTRWRRATGRRCRGCGYDMAGLRTSTCPECGRVARSERELQRLPARKRWRL